MTTGSVFVPGTPIPQGSMKGFVVGGRAILTSANTKQMPWRAEITAYVRAEVGSGIVFPRGPVELRMQFVFPRRVSEPKRHTPPHVRRPDTDKCVRNVDDALTGLIYTDDSQIVELSASKRTAEIGEQPGLYLTWIGEQE